MEVLDLKDPAYRLDPYPSLRRVQEAGPLCRIEPYGFVGVTRYDEVQAVLKNPKVFASSGTQAYFPAIAGAELFSRGSVLIGSDPPAHGRVRRLVQRAFTIPEMVAWEPKIEALMEDLLGGVRTLPAFDLIGQVAVPLPVTVIAAMLGVDPDHQFAFKRWSDDMVSVRSVQASDDAVWRARREAEIVQSCREFVAYFTDVIEGRRRQPGGADLISAMVRASQGDDQILQADEVLQLTRLMLVAGNETTTNLLGNAMTALLRHPREWQRLVADPALAAAAVEEALRYDSPVLQLTRRVTEDTELAGQPLAAGTVVSPLIAAANRDPRRFAEPDRFDIMRDASGHVAFGFGIHLCVGAPLARIETRIALRRLAEDFSDVALSKESPDMLESFILRGHRSLRLERGAAAIYGGQRHMGSEYVSSDLAT